MFLGITISSFAITCVIKAGLGCFAVTTANMALANWTGLTIGITGMIVELAMLSIATFMGEGFGLTSIVNATYGSILIDIFNAILPSHPLMILGLPLVAIGWALMGTASLGDSGSNILTTAISKKTNKSIGLIRGILECTLLLIGFIGARSNVTLFTLVLSTCLGFMLQAIYKVIKYEPKAIKHDFITKGVIK